MFSVSVGVLTKIIDFDIFVRYDTVNLNDDHHFQVLSTHRSVKRHKDVSVGTKGCLLAQRCILRCVRHKGVTVGIKSCQWAQRCVSGHRGVSADTEV